ncbi:MAG: hypothetical protein HOQ32_04570 [Lysobacter sp.]|nr:hypothetical protein [Lysobacter sp.]
MTLSVSWSLPVLLFAVWCLWAFTAIAERRARDLRLGVPEERRGGVSVLPVIPLFPLFFWGMAWLIDRWFSPWGSLTIGAIHVVLAAMMAYSLARDWRYLRRRRNG